MNSLINIINKLQEIIANSNIKTKIQLPQIVVIGSQSCGKTSILESIVGKDFLPKGTGIVTRRPLILQLKNILSGKEWAEFLHKGKERFEDFSQVCEEIEKETFRIAGCNKGISSEPILVKIFSPNVVDLTLVDLPGLVKVPIGEQPENIDILVRKLVLEYISNPNSIILAITPGNSDIANSDSLKIAKEVDPNYMRTLGVISKLDLVDHGSEVTDIVLNKVFPLHLGYIGVICRSQKDIASNKTIEDGVKSEVDYYEKHNEFKPLRSLLGVRNLALTLSSILVDHIRESFPNIKDTLSKEIYEKETELNILGHDNDFVQDEGLLSSFVLMLVFKFTNAYKEMIDGHMLKECSKFYIGGARINHIFQEIFKKEINSIDPYDVLGDHDIRTAIKNTNGLKPALFIPEAAFEVLIKQQIERLATPSLICVKRVYDELKVIAAQIEIPELSRYKKLEVKIKHIMEAVLDMCLEPTNNMITNLIEIEQSYINTSHPDFLGPEQSLFSMFEDSNISNIEICGSKLVNINSSNLNNLNSTTTTSKIPYNSYTRLGHLNAPRNEMIKIPKDDDEDIVNQMNTNPLQRDYIPYSNPMRPGMPSSRDIMETIIIKNLISSYYNVVKKNISDLVPKTIMCFLVNKSKKMAEKEMVSALYKSKDLATLLEEDPITEKKRKNLKESLLFLKSSLEMLNSFNELSLCD